MHPNHRGAWVEDTGNSDVEEDDEKDCALGPSEGAPHLSSAPLLCAPKPEPTVSREEHGLLALRRSLAKQVSEARAAANRANEEAEVTADAVAHSAALAKERRVRALETQMRVASEAEVRIIQLETERADVNGRVGSAAKEITRLRDTTETEQIRTQTLYKEKAAADHEAAEVTAQSKALIKQIKADIRARLVAELQAEAIAAKGDAKVQIVELAKRLEELKHEAMDLHHCMESERLALRDEHKRHQAALNDIRSRPQGVVDSGGNQGAARGAHRNGVWHNPRLKAQHASLADAKQERDSALTELRAAKDSEIETTKSLEEADMALCTKKEYRSKQKSQLENQLELATTSTEGACRLMEDSMRRLQERFASTLFRCKSVGVSYSELARRIKAECSKLTPHVLGVSDVKKYGLISVGGRTREGGYSQELCVICRGGKKSTQSEGRPKVDDGSNHLQSSQAVSYTAPELSANGNRGVAATLCNLLQRIYLWKLEADTARGKAELRELIEIEQTTKSEALAVASKVEVLSQALFKAQGDMTDAQASLELLHGHNRSIIEVEDHAERARSLQAQVRREKDELLRWKVAADAAENDLGTRRRVMEKNEVQLRLMDQELQCVAADKASEEAALRSVNAQLARLQLGGAQPRPHKVEPYANAGQFGEVQEAVEQTKLEIETVNKGLKRAKRMAATVRARMLDNNVDNTDVLAEITEQERQAEQLNVQASDFWRRKSAQDAVTREIESSVADTSTRLVESHLQLQIMSEALLVQRERHAELLLAKEKRANARLAICEAGLYACLGV